MSWVNSDLIMPSVYGVMIGKSIFTKTKAIIHFKKDNKLSTKPLFNPKKAKKNIKSRNE